MSQVTIFSCMDSNVCFWNNRNNMNRGLHSIKTISILSNCTISSHWQVYLLKYHICEYECSKDSTHNKCDLLVNSTKLIIIIRSVKTGLIVIAFLKQI